MVIQYLENLDAVIADLFIVETTLDLIVLHLFFAFILHLFPSMAFPLTSSNHKNKVVSA